LGQSEPELGAGGQTRIEDGRLKNKFLIFDFAFG